MKPWLPTNAHKSNIIYRLAQGLEDAIIIKVILSPHLIQLYHQISIGHVCAVKNRTRFIYFTSSMQRHLDMMMKDDFNCRRQFSCT